MILRDGKRVEIIAEKLVVGDIVFIKGGDKIPADLRLLDCQGCKVRSWEIYTMIGKSYGFLASNMKQVKQP